MILLTLSLWLPGGGVVGEQSRTVKEEFLRFWRSSRQRSEAKHMEPPGMRADSGCRCEEVQGDRRWGYFCANPAEPLRGAVTGRGPRGLRGRPGSAAALAWVWLFARCPQVQPGMCAARAEGTLARSLPGSAFAGLMIADALLLPDALHPGLLPGSGGAGTSCEGHTCRAPRLAL